jgi:peptide/nickel transport system permease protein
VENATVAKMGKTEKRGTIGVIVGRLRSLNHPFVRFVAKKAVFYLIVAFIALTFIFLIPRLMPGNPVDYMFGTSPPNTAGYLESKARLEAYYGFNKPLLEQYVNFWGQLLRGDLGQSFVVLKGRDVLTILMDKLPFTLVLVIPVLIISFFLGNWIGARAGYLKNKRSDIAYFAAVFANRMPSFWLVMVLAFLLGGVVKIIPTYGWYDTGLIPAWNFTFFLSVLHHYLLPFIALLVVWTGAWSSGMRSMIIYETNSGYMSYGQQLGFRKKKLMSYANRNAILPQFTGLNMIFNSLIGETLIIEAVLGWPGIGLLQFNSIMERDYPLILGTFLVIMVVVIFGNFLIDILYGIIDPRIRTGRGG